MTIRQCPKCTYPMTRIEADGNVILCCSNRRCAYMRTKKKRKKR